MKILFFIFLTFFLMILQSTVFPSFLWFENCFDLLIIEILFLSFIASRHSMIFAIIAIGCIMDSISGVPFGYHIFSYLWIYAMVYISRLLVFEKSIIFVLIMSIVSVFIQHVLLLFSIFINQGSDYLLGFNFAVLIKQTFWGFIFIPLSIWIVKLLWIRWNSLTVLMHK
jgi:hypothetical protein